jgi:hypothetical protein
MGGYAPLTSVRISLRLQRVLKKPEWQLKIPSVAKGTLRIGRSRRD